MNITDRLNHLEHGEDGANSYAWYITKQTVYFSDQCKLVDIIDQYQHLPSTISTTFEEFRMNFEISSHDNYRRIKNSAILGLAKPSRLYQNYEIADVFHVIKKKCREDFDDTDSYTEIMTSQLEKVYYPLPFDPSFERRQRQGYGLFITYYLYKIFIELIKETDCYIISNEEYKFFIATSKSYSDWKDTVNMILEYRKNPEAVTINATHLRNTEHIRLKRMYKDLKYLNIKHKYIELKKSYLDEIRQKVDEFEKSDYSKKQYTLATRDKYFEIFFSPLPLITTTPSISKEYLDEEEYTHEIYEVEIDPSDIKLDSNVDKEPTPSSSSGRKYKTNKTIGANIIAAAEYKCQFDDTHFSYISQKTNNMYVEAHHLIPMAMQEDFWNYYHKNLDTPENLVSLCPICHGILHKGLESDRNQILKRLYDIKESELKNAGINITLDDLLLYYKKR